MIWEEKLKKICLWGAAVMVWTPLLANVNFIFPFIVPKNMVFRLLILILMIPFAWLVIISRKLPLKGNFVFWALAVFLAANTLAAVLGVNPYQSFWGSYERMDGLFHLFLLGLFFALVTVILRKRVDWLVLFHSSMICSVFVGTYAWLNQFQFKLPVLQNGYGGTIGNPDFLGVYLMLNIFIAAAAFILDKENKNRYRLYVVLGALDVLLLFANAARGSILGFIIGTIILALFALPKLDKKWRWGVVAALLAGLLLAGAVYFQRDAAWVKKVNFINRFAAISLQDQNVANRLRVWKVAFTAFQDRPLLGYGPENIMYGINQHFDPDFTEQWFDRAHNFIFDYLMSSGIIGLLSYLLIFAAAFTVLFRKLKSNYWLSVVLSAGLVAYLVSNSFVFDTLSSWLMILSLLAFIGVYGRSDDRQDEFALPPILAKVDFAVIGLITLLVIFVAYINIVRPLLANLSGADYFRWNKIDHERALSQLQKGIALNTFGSRELILQLSRFSRDMSDNRRIDPMFKKKVMEEAEKYLLALLNRDSADVQARLALAQVYEAYASENSFYADEAIRVLEAYKSDFPNRAEYLTSLAQAYYLKGDLDQTVHYLKKVLELSRRDEQDYLNIINILAQKKDLTEMESYVAAFEAAHPRISTVNYVKLGQYYFNAGLIDRAEEILTQKAIPSNPANFSPYIALASIYESRGDWRQAIDYCRGVIEKYPQTKPELEEYIKYLQDKYKQ